MDNCHVGMITYIADPFDPPGYERFGGGHLFIYDLGRFLIQSGFKLTYVTRLNTLEKSLHQRIGYTCEINRLEVGPAEEIPPHQVALLLDDLYDATRNLLNNLTTPVDVLHSHYWIEGVVASRLRKEFNFRHVHSILSLGRLKRNLGEAINPTDELRDAGEMEVFRSADVLIAVCPDEHNNLLKFYNDIPLSNAVIIPYGVNTNVFCPRPESAGNYVRRATERFK